MVVFPSKRETQPLEDFSPLEILVELELILTLMQLDKIQMAIAKNKNLFFIFI